MITAACVFVGGAFDGELHNDIDLSAGRIELSRDDGLKPLASSTQEEPEIERTVEQYTIHPVSLLNDDADDPVLYAIAVPDGLSLTEAFEKMAASYGMASVEHKPH